MKNVFALALICYATVWGAVTGSVSASDSSPHPALSDTTPATHVLLAKKGASAGRTNPALTISKVRHHAHTGYTRVVLDLTGRVAFQETKSQRRATISLTNVTLSKRAQRHIKGKTFPRGIVITPRAPRTINIVLDLQVIRTHKVLRLTQPDRLAIDLVYAQKTPRATVKPKRKPEQKPKAGSSKPSKTVRKGNSPVAPSSKDREGVLVIIDPGHGGKDPGTIGRKGTKEKIIVLQISKYLRDLIQKRHKAKVVLTRSKDVFLDLEKRVDFANKKKLEWCGKAMRGGVAALTRFCLFVSVHVNSHPQKSIHGLEIYHFGKASDPHARNVAARENGMKGVAESARKKWEIILTDKMKDCDLYESLDFAETINDKLVRTLRKNYKIKNHGVKTGPFYVLRFTTMPSILAEVGFVSNSMEEKRLRTKTFQKKLAEGIYQGIQAYLKLAAIKKNKHCEPEYE